MAAKTGKFIVLEGCEGAGKSEQSKALAAWLTDKGHHVVLTREPGGRPGVDEGIAKIRSLLVESGNEWAPTTELMLFAAARHEHVEKVIRPALDNGSIVVCDRFSDSTLAYQGFGRGLGPDLCVQLRDIACGDLKPDLTVLIDVPAQVGLSRSLKRATDADRFEQEDISFHETVRAAFLRIAEQPGYAVVDGEMQQDAVETAIRLAYFEKFEVLWDTTEEGTSHH